jgi:hypothetical protein
VDPPITSKNVTFAPPTVKFNQSDKQYKVASILAMDQFKPYGRDELRVYDYVKDNKIDKLPPQPVKATEGSGSALFSANKPSGLTGLGAPKPATLFTGGTVQSGLNLPANLDLKSAQGLPFAVVCAPQTAAPYFVPAAHKIRIGTKSDERQSELNTTKVEDDWSGLFISKTKACGKEFGGNERIFISADDLAVGVPRKSEMALYDRSEKTREVVKFKTVPPLWQIRMESGPLHHLRIWKENVATIDFQKSVNVSGFDWEKEVIISIGFVDLYRNKRLLPPDGSGLNTEALIAMEGIWPKDDVTGERQKNASMRRLEEYESELKDYCRRKNSKFVFYLRDRGLFHFIVPGFTRGPYEIP